MNPPQVLDGARVLWWAWAGEVPFGELPGTQGDDLRVYGFAVCQYATGQLYRFTCNKHWEVMQDMDHSNEEDAKADIPGQYDADRVVWHRWVDPNSDASIA